MDVPHTCVGPDAHAVWDMDACHGCMQRGFTDFSSDKQRLFSVFGSGYEISAISLGGTGAYRTPKRPRLAVSWHEKQRHSGPVLQNEGGSALTAGVGSQGPPEVQCRHLWATAGAAGTLGE